MSKHIEQKALQQALDYHHQGNKPGKFAIIPTKPLNTQHDLSLAYSPGVAYPCLEIVRDPDKIYEYTNRSNMVAVISNGTAVLGLGNLGPAASKPVMEGKAVLFKKFADIDAIDVEINSKEIDELINIIKSLEYSWGGINLEDIKAPECFVIEERLKQSMGVPVFHDDQHGTAIIVLAGVINALHLTGRKFETLKIVVNGSGAAGIACLALLKVMGVRDENAILCDTKGVIYSGRQEGMNQWKAVHATDTKLRSLEEAMVGADLFLGLSAKGAVTQSMVSSMAKKPIIFALANPDPEITPEEVMAVRPDAIIATGRSDYNNQVNNVIGFPYIFRGALDVRATTINEEMKVEAAKALAALARETIPYEVYQAYGKKMVYGPEYILPAPFDPRLLINIPIAVAKAAIKTGVAKNINIDFDQYELELASRLGAKQNYIASLERKVKTSNYRVVFAEGCKEEVIKAAMLLEKKNYGKAILLGELQSVKNSLSNTLNDPQLISKFQIVDTSDSTKLGKYVKQVQKFLQSEYVSEETCLKKLQEDSNALAACIVMSGEADLMITSNRNSNHANWLKDLPYLLQENVNETAFSYSIVLLKDKNFLIVDSGVHENVTSKQLVNMTIQASDIANKLGYSPIVSFLSPPDIAKSAELFKEAIKILDSEVRDFVYCKKTSLQNVLGKKITDKENISQSVNILIMPDLLSASISLGLLESMDEAEVLGPIFVGLSCSAQIVKENASANEILNSIILSIIQAKN